MLLSAIFVAKTIFLRYKKDFTDFMYLDKRTILKPKLNKVFGHFQLPNNHTSTKFKLKNGCRISIIVI